MWNIFLLHRVMNSIKAWNIYWTAKFNTVAMVQIRKICLYGNLKPKLFGVLLFIEIVVSERRIFTETIMSIDNKTPNGLSLNVVS